MQKTYTSPRFAVIDGFLPRCDLEEIQEYVGTAPMRRVQSLGLEARGAAALHGEPLVGAVTFRHASKEVNLPKGSFRYPAGNALDRFVERLDEAADELVPWTGRRGDEWEFFTCTPYAYPLGSGISWHDDGKNRAGAFVFYAHKEWKQSWGAELLIEDTDSAPTRQVVDGRRTAATVGSYVAPLPNRLVVLRSGTLHTVKRVDVNAGENMRLSLAGFFQRTD